MNGRVYDYNLGRFLSVDPFIQDPGNSQSLNPYSYIMNNPLAGTDPTGYISESVEKVAVTGSRIPKTLEAAGNSITTGSGNLQFNGSIVPDNGSSSSGGSGGVSSQKAPNKIVDIGAKNNKSNSTSGGYNQNSCLKMSCHGADVSGHRQGTDTELLPLYLMAMGIEILTPVPKVLTIAKADKLADASEAGLKLLRTGDNAASALQYASIISKQKQIAGTAPANKSFLNSLDDAQKVLDNFNLSNYKLISENIKQSTVTIRVEGVSGRYINVGNPNGLPNVNKATNIFMIQSLKSPKIVPVNPSKGL
jgi:hypothetical protein